MDAIGRLKNERGSVLVLIAVGMVVLLALTALAIDLGYMYVAKGQLQNAADAAALAGAARLDGTASFAQYSARHSAKRFAGENNAAGKSVFISSNYSNSMSSSNDITVGHWNGTTYAAGATPVNAVEVRARRTETDANSPTPQIDLFFGKVIGFPKMGADATAIAAMEPKAGFYLFIGKQVCNQTGEIPLSDKITTSTGNMAWTSFFDSATSTGNVLQYLCPKDPPNIQVCNNSIYTTGGTVTPDYRAVQVDFYDPAYDAANKTFVDGIVDSWTVIVPVSEVDDPTKQPTPAKVWGYAKIRIRKVCAPEGGVGTTPCENRPNVSQIASCKKYSKDVNDAIVIDSIECRSCKESDLIKGTKPGLVR